jgi:hypothetical protein
VSLSVDALSRRTGSMGGLSIVAAGFFSLKQCGFGLFVGRDPAPQIGTFITALPTSRNIGELIPGRVLELRGSPLATRDPHKPQPYALPDRECDCVFRNTGRFEICVRANETAVHRAAVAHVLDLKPIKYSASVVWEKPPSW